MSDVTHLLPGESSAELRDWFVLLKPRVISLVVFTGAIGLLMAPTPIHPVLAFAAVLCIAVAAGAAGALNMWFDRDIDALMRRTANRPIPGGRIEASDVLGFGIVLAVSSVLLMYLATNVVAASWLAVSILFYVVVYTMWLKRLTPQNIVIGGAAGAFPPIIGWAAATGSVGVLPLLMFAIVFFWTPPHFWALSLYASADYERAGVPMLPVVAGGALDPVARPRLHHHPRRDVADTVSVRLFRPAVRDRCGAARRGVHLWCGPHVAGPAGCDGAQLDQGRACEVDVQILAALSLPAVLRARRRSPGLVTACPIHFA